MRCSLHAALHARHSGLRACQLQVQLKARLAQRQRRSAADCVAALEHQAATFMQASVVPTTSLDSLPPGSYYLDSVDGACRRVYKRRSVVTEAPAGSGLVVQDGQRQ